MFDVITGILWSITYLLIAVYGIRYIDEKKIMMPLNTGSVCIAWELNALIISQGHWVHILWLGLDIIIFVLNMRNIGRLSLRVSYAVFTLIWVVIFAVSFRLPDIDIMLFSSFLLDLGIAIAYIVKAKDISRHGQIPIAVTKLCGDLCAFIHYSQYFEFIAIVGLAVFLLNLYYLAKSLDLISHADKNAQ